MELFKTKDAIGRQGRSFMHYDLGFFDHKTGRLESVDDLFAMKNCQFPQYKTLPIDRNRLPKARTAGACKQRSYISVYTYVSSSGGRSV